MSHSSISGIYRKALRLGPSLGVSRARALLLLGFQAAAIVFEGVGITLLLPIVQFIQNQGDLAKLVEAGRYWRWIIDLHASLGLPVTLLGLVIGSFSAIVMRQAFGFMRTYLDGRSQEYAVRQVRLEAFRRFVSAAQSSQDGTKIGEIVNDLIVEVPRAVGSVIFVVRLAGSLLLIGLYAAVLTWLSVWLTAAALLVVLAALVAIRGLLQRTRDTSMNITAMNQRLSGFLNERLRSGRLIRLSGSEKAEIQQFRHLTGKQTARLYHMHRINATVGAIMEPMAVAAALALLYFGTQYFGMSIETIGLFAIILIRLMPAVTEGVRTHNAVLSYSGSLDAVTNRLAHLDTAREPNRGSVEFAGLKDRIVFDDVSFVYVDSAAVPALRNVSVEIPAGQITGLVGPSGAGKSTLIDLLPRVRQPTGGKILFDGQLLEDFTLKSLRARIAFVPQTPQIFDLPIRDQISYGNPEIDELAIRRAAELAGAVQFIDRLPDGYATMLGESGYRLSGGQRQRLDIARALARKASILILDEPTSQLDAETERGFRETLYRLRQTGLTIIVIAHRLSTIVDADRIVVLDQGRVVGAGTHEHLLRTCGWYRQASSTGTRTAHPQASA